MKIQKRIFAAAMSGILIYFTSVMPVAAAVSNRHAWDGKSKLSENYTYYIFDNVTVNGSFTLPESSTMILVGGGSITVPSGNSLDIGGRLSVQGGAGLFVNGAFDTAAGSQLSVDGILSSGSKSKVDIYGDVYCGRSGQTAFYGTTVLADNASLSSYGDISAAGSFFSSSSLKIYDGSFTVSGKAELGKNSTTDIYGGFAIASGALVENKGELTLENDARYTLKGSYYNTDNGHVTDNRIHSEKSSMTAEALSLYTGTKLKGIDISWAQGGDVDWKKVKDSGIDFAILRSSRGRLDDDYPITADTTFYNNVLGANQNGIPVGVYHYCYAETVEEARDDARMVLSLIEGYNISYPVIFDIEDSWYIDHNYSRETLTAMTAAFCEEIMNGGYIPMVYSYVSFLDKCLDMDELSKYPVWVAHVDVSSPSYDRPYFMWQYSWKGNIDGIEDENGDPMDVDLDYSYIDFAAYTKKYHLNRQ